MNRPTDRFPDYVVANDTDYGDIPPGAAILEGFGGYIGLFITVGIVAGVCMAWWAL